MESKFFQETVVCCSGYEYVRDDLRAKEHKVFIESLWGKYQNLADTHFLSDACNHFQERFWEMYLGVTLLEKGYGLNADLFKDPEFYFSLNDKKVWVEAVAPGLGEGVDAVPELVPDTGVHKFPEEKIILRIRNAIEGKHKKLLKYKEDKIVGSDDSFVLAINGARMGVQAAPAPVGKGITPLILKAVFPIGSPYGVWNEAGELVYEGHTHRDAIEKKNKAEVSTDVFLDKRYSDISAIIYSGVNYCNYPEKVGENFQVVHNCLAEQPLGIGALGLGVEY